MTSADSSMNQVLRGRGHQGVPTGQANADAPDDPIAQAKEIAAEIAGQLDTLTKLLAKASAPGANPFAPKG